MSVNDSRLLVLCDGKLETDDGYTFRIHRHMLARKSQYFSSMFCGINGDRKEFTVPGVSGNCLAEILLYIYTDNIYATEQNLAELLKTADYFLMTDLILQLKQSFMKYMTVGNCLEIFKTSYLINDKHIFRKSFRFIETRYEEIVSTQMNDLTELPLELLEKILRSRSLRVYRETTVWLSIAEWLQKDISTRIHCVPQLSMSLAGLDLDEKLATEIVSENFTEALQEIECSKKNFSSNLQRVLYILENCLSIFKNPGWSRTPSHMHVITVGIENGFLPKYVVYVTYDENIDLWRKVGEIHQYLVRRSLVVGHRLFLFNICACKQFDILSQQWIPMTDLRDTFFINCALHIQGYLYVFGDFRSENVWEFGMEVYDMENNRWFDRVLLNNIYRGVFVTVAEKIYAVGYTQDRFEMTTQMFDPLTQQWTALPPPKMHRRRFALLAYRGRVYVMGGYSGGERKKDVEVFDPATNLWTDLPPLPKPGDDLNAFVLNDQIFVSSSVINSKRDIFRWSESEERWETLEKTATNSFRCFMDRHFFSSVDDVNAIRDITKQNRDPRVNLRRSPFFY